MNFHTLDYQHVVVEALVRLQGGSRTRGKRVDEEVEPVFPRIMTNKIYSREYNAPRVRGGHPPTPVAG